MELLIKTITISLFCCGLRFVSSKGMILYFLRLPYDLLQKQLKKEKKHLKFIKKGVDVSGNELILLNKARIVNDTKRIITFYKLLIIILKPVIGCVTCMTSVYTPAIDWLYYGHCDRYTLLLIFMVACINTLAYALYEKLSNG